MANDILVVTGMHRSGTSLITHWLHECGLQVGESLLEAGKGNVEGHFEDLEFLKIHEEILTGKGADADGLRPPFDVIPTRYEKAKMKAIISVKNAIYPQWGWKEPRTCLFLGTYAELLPDAKYLVVVRDYKEVIQSLLKRDFSHIDEKYQRKGWPYRIIWKYIYRPIRLKKQYEKNYSNYLKAWVAYNRMILKTLHSLPENRYLVVNYKLMKDQCVEAFNFLSLRWSFQLLYKDFASIYKSELITQSAEDLPETANEALLAEAEEVSTHLGIYLQKSTERLARQEFALASN
jgi:hypothetical protein